MGHVTDYLSFPESMPLDKIKQACNDWEYRNKDLREGTRCTCGDRIEWKTDKVYDTEENAYTALDRMCSGKFYPQMAVLCRKNEKIFVCSAELQDMRKSVAALKKQYEEQFREPYFDGCKCKTVACMNCGSAIAAEYLQKNGKGMQCNRNVCPVCGADLRPKTVTDRLKDLRARVEEESETYRKMYREERRLFDEKGELYWLIHVETHC